MSTKDTYGRKCNSSQMLKEVFNAGSVVLAHPCSNAFYTAIVSLKCDPVKEQQSLNIRTPPEAPEIKSMLPTSSSMKVEWSQPPGPIQSYQVFLRSDSNEYEAKPSDTYYVFYDLKPYTFHEATVMAKYLEQSSPLSQGMGIRTLQGAPIPPQDLQTTEITTDKITLVWRDQEQETGPILTYRIYWGEISAAYRNNGNTTNTSYVIGNLFPYTNYQIAVEAVNSVGTSDSSSLNAVTKLAAPDPPDMKTAKVTNVSISVDWDLSSTYRGPDPEYDLRWKVNGADDDDFEQTHVSNPSKGGFYTIQNLQPFTAYELQIRGNNSAGYGRWSRILEAKTLIGIPSEPKNLEVSSKSATHVRVSWGEPVPANGPILRYMAEWRSKSKPAKTVYTSTTNFNFTNLSPYTEYNFSVCASTEAGWGNSTPTLKVKTKVGVPSEPLNLTETIVTNVSVNIQWMVPKHKNAPSLTYVIRWVEADYTEGNDYYYLDDTNDNATARSFDTDEVDTTFYEIRNLRPYTNYSIQVSAKTSAGVGEYTDPLVIQTIAGIPSSPTKLKAALVETTSITLMWSAPEFTNGPLLGYVVFWGVKGTEGSHVRASLRSYKAVGLRPFTEYFFNVAAESEGGAGDYTLVYQTTKISTPSAPRNLISTSVTDHCVVIQWSVPEHPSAPLLQYTVTWREVSPESSILSHETNSTSYRIRNLDPETDYSIRVRASSKAGEGPWTNLLYIQTKQKDQSSAVVAGSVVGGLLAILLIACLILFYYARKRGGLRNIMQSKPEAKSSETLQTTISIPLEVVNDSGKLSIADFDEHVLKLMSNGYYKLTQEFEKLGKESPAFSTNEAKKNDNLTKNRWVKILPFDHSRVKLRPVGDEVEPDFINASYVPGDSYLLEYIATQGPLPNTVDDLWRMVWQESVFLMVMLTQCVERAKRTCERYWPAAGTAMKYGELDVQTVSESITPAYIQRLFLVSQGNKQRHIVHLHYMNWPVSGCPKSPDDFLSFVRTVRSQVSCGVTGPMLVHCSAGIGRTGTFIAVDRLAQLITRQCHEVDIYGTVLDMRRFRSNLVQTEEQYYFIYLCIQQIIREKRKEMEEDYGGGIYSN